MKITKMIQLLKDAKNLIGDAEVYVQIRSKEAPAQTKRAQSVTWVTENGIDFIRINSES